MNMIVILVIFYYTRGNDFLRIGGYCKQTRTTSTKKRKENKTHEEKDGTGKTIPVHKNLLEYFSGDALSSGRRDHFLLPKIWKRSHSGD